MALSFSEEREFLMEKEVLPPHEEHSSTGSPLHHHVPSKSDTFSHKKQASDRGITLFLQSFDQCKPQIRWIILCSIAVYHYIHTADMTGLLVLMGVADRDLSIRQAIALLQGLLKMPMKLPSLPERKEEKDERT